MAQDYDRREKVDVPTPQLYKGNPEDLERFISQLQNVWALQVHKYKNDITKI